MGAYEKPHIHTLSLKVWAPPKLLLINSDRDTSKNNRHCILSIKYVLSSRHTYFGSRTYSDPKMGTPTKIVHFFLRGSRVFFQHWNGFRNNRKLMLYKQVISSKKTSFWVSWRSKVKIVYNGLLQPSDSLRVNNVMRSNVKWIINSKEIPWVIIEMTRKTFYLYLKLLNLSANYIVLLVNFNYFIN